MSVERFSGWPYTDAVDPFPVEEDERGVDVSQIRRLLDMTVEERVLHMVQVANAFIEVRQSARFVDTSGSG